MIAVHKVFIYCLLLLCPWIVDFAPAQTAPERQRAVEAITTDSPARPIQSDLTLLDDGTSLLANLPKPGPIMLWTIEKDEWTGHIVGSVHLADESIYPLPEPIVDAFNLADVVVFEVDPADMNMGFQQKLMAAGKLPEYQRLRDLITPETARKLEAAKTRNHFPQNLDDLEPWYIALIMTMVELARNTDHAFSPEFGVDRYFDQLAKSANKNVRGLETADEQLNLLTSLSGELGVELLDQTLDELYDIKNETRRMLDAWRDGNIDALWKLVRENFADYPALYQQWLVTRNIAWARTIESLFNEGARPFIVVGAGHLAGPDGLPELLRARGFTVTQFIQAGMMVE